MSRGKRLGRFLMQQAGRIRVRLLAVNLVVVLIPVFGLEFARIYERQLLDGLERDMKNQASLSRAFVEASIDAVAELDTRRIEATLARAARNTRTRIRIVTPDRGVVADSHRDGPPEGKEPAPPLLARDALPSMRWVVTEPEPPTPILSRPEVQRALAGTRATHTRVAHEPSAVYLFLAEPIRREGKVVAAVYLTRSTNPVLLELHRIRRGLVVVLCVALALAGVMTLALALSISRPLERLAGAARRIAAGEGRVTLPSGGGGEISELSAAFDEMTKQLESRQRYISQFAADVAHEFKSPLTSIRGAAELLAEGAADDPRARGRFLANIALDAERLDRLVSRLLELSRIEAAEAPRSPVRLRELLERVVERAESPTQRVVLSYVSDVEYTMARAGDLESAFINLIDNALRASPPSADVHVEVWGNQRDGAVEIRVVDRGHGIPEAIRGKIFERFFSTDAEGDGTGLGLAIVQRVVEAHRGSVRFDTEVGAGSTFTVCIPLTTVSLREPLAP
ncbi:MAG TPA: ATP-binding protein [Polyangiaceae bacterium]|nr:ATP-binding protein [Polyangiaceae bacterium]